MRKKGKKNRENRIKNIFSSQNGMALLATLIFVFILVTFAVALLTMTSNDSKMSTLQRASNKAFYLADAGIEEAFWKLNTPTPPDGEGEGIYWRPTDEPAPGTSTEYYQVTIGDDGADKIKIISTGTVKGGKYSSGKRTIEVTAEIDFLITSTYVYAVLADKIILFQGTPGPAINGDVHSNDDILVSGHFADYYEGNATSSGSINDINDDGIDKPTKPIPGIDYGNLFDLAFNAGNVIDGNKSLDNGETWGTKEVPITGIHYIKGDLEAKNGSDIFIKNGAIIVEGNVNIKEGAYLEIDNTIDPEDPITALALVAQGNIKIYSKSIIGEGVVQSITADGISEGFIELKNGCEITGSVIADTVYVRNKSTVSYSGTLGKITTKGDPFYKKISWREAY